MQYKNYTNSGHKPVNHIYLDYDYLYTNGRHFFILPYYIVTIMKISYINYDIIATYKISL